jgi:hypothetical protein
VVVAFRLGLKLAKEVYRAWNSCYDILRLRYEMLVFSLRQNIRRVTLKDILETNVQCMSLCDSNITLGL